MLNKWSYFFFLIIVCITCLAQSDFIEAQIYAYNPYNKIKATIGTKSQNRICFETMGIKEIIGDSLLYQIIHDSSGDNLFLIPKVASGKTIEVTLISNSNKVQDLSLKVEDKFGQTIIIRSSKIE